MRKPLIGITSDDYLANNAPKYSRNFILRQNYCSAIEKAGGVPIILPYIIELIDQYSSYLDALIISGGDFDVDPSYFGEAQESKHVTTKPVRTSFEIKIINNLNYLYQLQSNFHLYLHLY